MSKQELFKRYCVFMLGISIASVGVTLVTRSTLGVNSITCASFVISSYFPVTMGAVTIAFNVAMMVFQYALYPKAQWRSRTKNILMQIPAMIVFGLLVDLVMYLTRDFHPENIGYWACFATFLIGIIIISVNLVLQSTANVAMLPCDAFVIKLAQVRKWKMGIVKLTYDLTLVGLAAAISLWCSNFTTIIGIREGTILGAVLIGPTVQLILPYFAFIERFLSANQAAPGSQELSNKSDAN